jgi:hypothetical protein
VSPYLGLSVGSYKDAKEVSAFEDWEAIPDSERKTHTQVTAGVRIAWDFGGTLRDASLPAATP